MKLTAKKIQLILTSLLIIANCAVTSIAQAQTGLSTTDPNTTNSQGSINPNDLFHKVEYVNGGNDTKLGIVKNLPEGDWQTLLGSIIRLVLGLTGTVTFGIFTYGGILMVYARGKEEDIDKAKGILTWSLVGLTIIAISYAIVLGLSRLRFGV